MIFAEMNYAVRYEDIHDDIGALLRRNFPHVESGLQGDSHFAIRSANELVKVDTFTCMCHEVKSTAISELVSEVIQALETEYRLTIFNPPKFEGHE